MDRDCTGGCRIAVKSDFRSRPHSSASRDTRRECGEDIFHGGRSVSFWHTCKERVELMRRKNGRHDIASLRNSFIKALQRCWNSRRSPARIETFTRFRTKKPLSWVSETYDRASCNYALVISAMSFTTYIKDITGNSGKLRNIGDLWFVVSAIVDGLQLNATTCDWNCV